MSMKAVGVLPSEKVIRLVELPEPKITDDEHVLIEMKQVGICGTDMEIARFEYGDPPDGESFLVLGHESLGEIVDVGKAVRGLEPGDLVVMTVRRPCGRCFPCKVGRQDYCETGDFVERGINRSHGYMTERVVENAANCVKLARELAGFGVLLEPLTIFEKGMQQVEAVLDRFPVNPQHQPRALVLGAGPVSALGAFGLAVRGYDVTVLSRMLPEDPRAAIFTRYAMAYRSVQQTTPESFLREDGPVDLIYEGAGHSGFAFHWLRVLATNGVAVLTGIPGPRGPIELDTDALMRQIVLKNQVILGTVNADILAFASGVCDLERFMERFPESLPELISTRVPIDSVPQMLEEQRRENFKTIITLES